MLNYNELLPVLLVGFICGVIACIDRYKIHIQGENNAPDFKLLSLDLIKNTIYSTLLACFIFWLALLFTDNYQVRLGVVGIISILGLDKALSLVEKIMSLKR